MTKMGKEVAALADLVRSRFPRFIEEVEEGLEHVHFNEQSLHATFAIALASLLGGIASLDRVSHNSGTDMCLFVHIFLNEYVPVAVAELYARFSGLAQKQGLTFKTKHSLDDVLASCRRADSWLGFCYHY